MARSKALAFKANSLKSFQMLISQLLYPTAIFAGLRSANRQFSVPVKPLAVRWHDGRRVC
jgi:hypothetical protein